MNDATLLLVHGWGLGPGSWRPLLDSLGNPRHHTLDLGFFGRKKIDIPTDRPLIAVGHSLGFLWILHHMGMAAWGDQVQGLISINGFPRFSQAEDFSNGVKHCIIRRMKNGLQRDPAKVLNDFRARGGGLPGDLLSDEVKRNINALALAYGLGWLLEWDDRSALSSWQKPLMVIANQDDNIVTPAMTNDSFSSLPGSQLQQIHWLSGGGHIGLLVRPKGYGELVDDFCGSLF
jgi:pimeloyl-[acyl-carrier protein] methyl ester esterase